MRSGSMQARIGPRVTRRWLRESRKCHKSNPDQLIHTNLLSRPTGSGIVMPASGLTLFRGSQSHKESAAALKLDEGAFLYLISCVRATRSPSISPPIKKHFGAKSYIGEASFGWVLTTHPSMSTPHGRKSQRHRPLVHASGGRLNPITPSSSWHGGAGRPRKHH